jgi:hypothetical protein
VRPASQGQRANEMQISWNDVNRMERTGPHLVTKLKIDVFVRERHVENWKADPDSQHRVIEISTTFGTLYAIGAFEPSEKIRI